MKGGIKGGTWGDRRIKYGEERKRQRRWRGGGGGGGGGEEKTWMETELERSENNVCFIEREDKWKTENERVRKERFRNQGFEKCKNLETYSEVQALLAISGKGGGGGILDCKRC